MAAWPLSAVDQLEHLVITGVPSDACIQFTLEGTDDPALTTKAVAVLTAMLLAACAVSSDEQPPPEPHRLVTPLPEPVSPAMASLRRGTPAGVCRSHRRIPDRYRANGGWHRSCQRDYRRDQCRARRSRSRKRGGFDPDRVPVRVDEARAAWIRIAQQEAPSTIGYIDFIYADGYPRWGRHSCLSPTLWPSCEANSWAGHL